MDPITFEDITIKLPELRVYYKKVERHLTFAELRLLLILISDPLRIIPAEELLHRSKLTTKESLAKYVNSLRNILDQKYIYNARNFGYAFQKKQDSHG